MKRLTILLFLFTAISLAQSAPQIAMETSAKTQNDGARADVLIEMTTSEGPVTLRLFGDTPRHLDNFVKLAEEGYYDGMLFHRVIKDFMVQTGDPDSKEAKPGQLLGMGSPDYQIEAEIDFPRHFHKQGALAAARQGDNTNPRRKSSGSQFYIVTGRKYTAAELDRLEMNLIRQQKQDIVNRLIDENHDSIMALRRNRDQAGLRALQEELNEKARKIAAGKQLGFTQEQIDAYTTVGGAPHLDGTYTVFGQVESGFDVIDRIQKAEADGNNRPVEDIRLISMKVIK